MRKRARQLSVLTHSAGGLLLAIILIGSFSRPEALGEPMTTKSLHENRQACMSSCIKSSGGDPRCATYCECGMKEIAEQMTEEEYQAGKTAITNKQRPAQESLEKVLAIAQSCAANLH
jgi:hypothetical protein